MVIPPAERKQGITGDYRQQDEQKYLNRDLTCRTQNRALQGITDNKMNSNTLIGISPAEHKTGDYRHQKDEE